MSLSVWVGLSIFCCVANKRLALSRQAALAAGPPSQGSPSGALTATDIKKRQTAMFAVNELVAYLQVFTC